MKEGNGRTRHIQGCKLSRMSEEESATCESLWR